MEGEVLKITGLTARLEMEIGELLGDARLLRRCAEAGDLFAAFDADGAVVGCACAERSEENCMIHFVVVRPGSRQEGTGSALVNHILGFFAGKCDRAYVAAGPAAPFLERFGFVPVGPEELPADVACAGLTASAGAPANDDADARDAGPAADDGSPPGEDSTLGGVMMLELPSRWTIP